MAVKNGMVVFDLEVGLSSGSALEFQEVMIRYGKECWYPGAEKARHGRNCTDLGSSSSHAIVTVCPVFRIPNPGRKDVRKWSYQGELARVCRTICRQTADSSMKCRSSLQCIIPASGNFKPQFRRSLTRTSLFHAWDVS